MHILVGIQEIINKLKADFQCSGEMCNHGYILFSSVKRGLFGYWIISQNAFSLGYYWKMFSLGFHQTFLLQKKGKVFRAPVSHHCRGSKRKLLRKPTSHHCRISSAISCFGYNTIKDIWAAGLRMNYKTS